MYSETTAQRTLALLLQALTALGALLFLIGWSYGRSYYGSFSIGLNKLEIPVTSYLVWVQPLIREQPFWLLIFPIFLFSVCWWFLPLIALFTKYGVSNIGPLYGHCSKDSGSWVSPACLM